jgi:hypothetical protein
LNPQEIKVVVNHKDDLTLEGLCTAVVSRASGGCFTRNKKKGKHYQLDFISADPQIGGRTCRVIFIQSGGSLPRILEDFDEIVHISEVPVLPVHAILLEQLLSRSLLTSRYPPAKGAARFVKKCLRACGDTPLQQLSPLWQSLDILNQIAQHVQVLPDTKTHWIARGIDPSTFTPTLWSLQDVPDEAAKDVDSDDGGSDSGASEGPSAIVQALNVAPEEPDHDNWHSALTDAAARHVVDILKGFGIECAVVGSAASQLYSHGETRAPEVRRLLDPKPL